MADKLIRIGRVSKIDYEHGMISVTYPDLDDAVTVLLSTLSFNDEYKMPKVEDEVVVLHLPSGQSRGIVLGHYWNETNIPAKTGEKIYRKEFGHDPGKAYAEYEDSGTLIFASDNAILIDANNVTLKCQSGSITVAELLEMKRKVDILWSERST